jgi:hypothetical protein
MVWRSKAALDPHWIIAANAFGAMTFFHAPYWHSYFKHPSPPWNAASPALVEKCALVTALASRPDFDSNRVHRFIGFPCRSADDSL